MKEQDMPKADFVTAAVLLVMSVGIIIISLRMPTFADRGRELYNAPGLVPLLLGGVTGLLSLALLIRSIRRRGYRLGLNGSTVSAFFTKSSTTRVIVTIVLSVLYALILLGRMHYVIATILYVFAFIVLFEYERGKTLQRHLSSIGFGLLEAVLVSLSVAGVFQYLFLVNLP